MKRERKKKHTTSYDKIITEETEICVSAHFLLNANYIK